MTISASLLLTACSSYHPRSPTPTPFPRGEVSLERQNSVLSAYEVSYPKAWTLEERRKGAIVLLTPSAGRGRLRLIAMLDHDPPATLSRAYAQVVCSRALLSVGLQPNIRAVRVLGPNHMTVLSSGAAAGTSVNEIVHLFGTGRVVVAFFRAPSFDGHFETANRIMKSVRLKETS